MGLIRRTPEEGPYGFTLKNKLSRNDREMSVSEKDGEYRVEYTLVGNDIVDPNREFISPEQFLDFEKNLKRKGLITFLGGIFNHQHVHPRDVERGIRNQFLRAEAENQPSVFILFGALASDKYPVFNIYMEFKGWKLYNAGNTYEGRGGKVRSLIQRGWQRIEEGGTISLVRDQSIPENEAFVKIIGQTQGHAYSSDKAKENLGKTIDVLTTAVNEF